MTFLKYFAAKEELSKSSSENIRDRIRSLSSNMGEEVEEEQDETEYEPIDGDVISNGQDELDAATSALANVAASSLTSTYE